jgi:hypothetical protein
VDSRAVSDLSRHPVRRVSQGLGHEHG